MNVAKLTDEQLRATFAPDVMERAEGSVGQFHDCTVENGNLHGKIRGNHGYYQVTLFTSKKSLITECNCKAAAEEPCKHAAALGLSYLFTPWTFKNKDKIDRNKFDSIDDIHFYVAMTPLRQLLDELRGANIGLSKLAEMVNVTPQQIATVVKSTESGAQHIMGELLKIACLYLLDHKVVKAGVR